MRLDLEGAVRERMAECGGPTGCARGAAVERHSRRAQSFSLSSIMHIVGLEDVVGKRRGQEAEREEEAGNAASRLSCRAD